MSPEIKRCATAECEAALLQHMAYDQEHNILPSHIEIVDRLLARRLELVDAYTELHAQLSSTPSGLWVFFDLILGSSSLWNPTRNKEARCARARLEAINRAIAEKAANLAGLLEERDNLHNASGFASGTYYHPVQLIDRASTTNYLYRSFVKLQIDSLRGQFDLKYWPSLPACLQALAEDADQAEVQASDSFTEAATRATRGSLADFFKVVLKAIEENGASHQGPLPPGFRLGDAALASIANCALDLGPDEIVDSAYVKRLRQRERIQAKT